MPFVGKTEHPLKLRELSAEACRAVLAQYERFAVDKTVYGHLRDDYEALLATLTTTSTDDPAELRQRRGASWLPG